MLFATRRKFYSFLCTAICRQSSFDVSLEIAEHLPKVDYICALYIILTRQSLGQQGPLHDLVSFSVGHAVPLHEGWVLIVRERA